MRQPRIAVWMVIGVVLSLMAGLWTVTGIATSAMSKAPSANIARGR